MRQDPRFFFLDWLIDLTKLNLVVPACKNKPSTNSCPVLFRIRTRSWKSCPRTMFLRAKSPSSFKRYLCLSRIPILSYRCELFSQQGFLFFLVHPFLSWSSTTTGSPGLASRLRTLTLISLSSRRSFPGETLKTYSGIYFFSSQTRTEMEWTLKKKKNLSTIRSATISSLTSRKKRPHGYFFFSFCFPMMDRFFFLFSIFIDFYVIYL